MPDQQPVRRIRRSQLRKPFDTEDPTIDPLTGQQIPSGAKNRSSKYSWTNGSNKNVPIPSDSYRHYTDPRNRVQPTQPKYDMGTGSLPTPSSKATIPAPAYNPKKIPNKFDGKKLTSAMDAFTPYASNVINAIRKPPTPKIPGMVSAVSVSSPSLAGERVDIDRTIRGVNNSADLNLDANTAAAVKTGNLVQGFRAKGQSYTNEANMRIQATNAANQSNAGIEAFNAQRMDQYNNEKLGMQIAQQRESSQNIANFADKRVAEIARKDAMGLDEKKFNILTNMYSSGVLDRLVKKVNGNDQVTPNDLDVILHGDTKANGGLLANNRFPRKVKLRKVANTPPEMADQYKRNGGYIGGSIMHAPRINSKGKLRRVY